MRAWWSSWSLNASTQEDSLPWLARDKKITWGKGWVFLKTLSWMCCSVFSFSTYGTWVTSVPTTLLKSTETWVTGGEVEFSLSGTPSLPECGNFNPLTLCLFITTWLRSESDPTWAYVVALRGGLHSRTFKIYHLGFLNCFVLFISGQGSRDKDQMHSLLNHTK